MKKGRFPPPGDLYSRIASAIMGALLDRRSQSEAAEKDDMRRKLVAGNWKMHGSLASNKILLEGLCKELPRLDKIDVLVIPPAVYLTQAAALLREAGSAIALGAQDVSAHGEGAFTGQLSAAMLKELGCSYVLAGHSERRALCGETDREVAAKALAAVNNGLIPIVCVGETLAEREAGQALDVVSRQVQAVIEALGTKLDRAVVAYEPVWAIGTGLTATPEQAQEVHAHIRKQLGRAGAGMTVLYGGSVKADNAAELFAQPDIDGALVGGASLKVEEFAGICNKAERI